MSDPLSVLIVEDDPNDVALITRAFRKAQVHHPLIVIGDGDSAVKYLEGRGEYADRELHPLPALMLLDLKLPRRSGLEVLAWLRKQPGLRRLPVVVLTGSDQRSDINAAYDMGASSYLVKPVLFEGLLDLMRTLNLYWLVVNERATIAFKPS